MGARAQCRPARFARDYRFAEDAKDDDLLPPELRATFQGYRRANGKTGTRNYLGILTSVNCSASVARFAAARGRDAPASLDDYPDIDGVVAIVHGTGCGHAAYGEGFEVLRRTQWGYASHPNFAGVVMVGLGCEVFQIGRMKKEYGLEETDTFRTLTIQETGGTRKTVDGDRRQRSATCCPIAARRERETRPASELMLALQCGGSDGYSGLTANPALGAASDLLVRHGGTSILSETPEIYGAEHLLTRRAATPRGRREARRAHPLVGGLHRAQRRRDEQQPLARQQGRRPHHDPREVARRRRQGRPGDPARRLRVRRAGRASTASSTWTRPATTRSRRPARSPAARNLICFTTGRGSAFGCKPAPSIKLATNSDIYRRMIDDMDINCGDILDGVSIEEKGREIFDKVLARRLRRAHQVRGPRLRRPRVRALADRRGDVRCGQAAGKLMRGSEAQS